MRSLATVVLVLMALQEPDVEALLRGLSDESIEVRERSLKTLIELGPKAEAKVRATMESSQGEIRRLCESILAKYAYKNRLESVLPPLKRVSIDARDRSLKDVLKELQSQTGLPVEHADIPDGVITLQVKDATPLEAVTAVCRVAGLGFEIGSGPGAKGAAPPVKPEPAVWLKADGFADTPRQFVRHFELECSRVTLRRMTRFDFMSRTCSVGLRLMWPPGVRPDSAYVDIAKVCDDKGVALYEKPAYATFGQGGDMMFPGRPAHSASGGVEFKQPGDEVESVTVRGSVLVHFAGEDRYFTFESPEQSLGQKKEKADMSVELRDFKLKDGVTIVSVLQTGQPRNPVPGRMVYMGSLGSSRYQVRLEDGTTVTCRSTHGRGGGGSTHVMELHFPGLTSKVTAFEVLAETAYHEERFDFELKDIPLPK